MKSGEGIVSRINKVKTREGDLAPFDRSKVAASIAAAIRACGRSDEWIAEKLAPMVESALARRFDDMPPTVDDVAYFIEQGSVRVFCMVDGKRFDIGVLKAGSILGEMALIDSAGRMASAEAAEPATLRVIPRKAIEFELRRAEPLVRAMLMTLVHNIRALNARTLAARSGPHPAPESKP